MAEHGAEFLCGYAAALADFHRSSHGDAVVVVDLMNEAGLSLHTLKRAGVDEADLAELSLCAAEIPLLRKA